MSAAFCSCAAWAHTHSPLSLLPAFVLRSFCAGSFVLVLRWFSVAPCALRCCLLFSCHQNAAVEKRPCLGHHPSPQLCFRVCAQFDDNLPGSDASLCNRCHIHPLLPFLTSACTRVCGSTWRIHPDKTCMFVCVHIQSRHTHTCKYASVQA